MPIRALFGLALLGALLACGEALAEETAQVEPTERYDPDQALVQSLGYTLGVCGAGGLLLLVEPVFGATTLGLGLSIAPSMGHFYADAWAHGALTAAGRLVAGGAAVVLLVGAAFPARVDSSSDPEEWTQERVGFLAGGLTAAAVAVGLAVFDIATARESARRANRALEAAAPRLRVTAGAGPGAGGLALSGSF